MVVDLFIYLGFYIAFNTVQVISRQVVGRAEETSTYSLLGFGTVNCRPTASNYQLSHLRPCRELNPGLKGGRRECYHSAAVAPNMVVENILTGKRSRVSTRSHNDIAHLHSSTNVPTKYQLPHPYTFYIFRDITCTKY